MISQAIMWTLNERSRRKRHSQHIHVRKRKCGIKEETQKENKRHDERGSEGRGVAKNRGESEKER